MLELKPLPYQSLEPFISTETLSYHYTKHHQTYLDNLNKLLNDNFKNLALEEIIIKSHQDKNIGVFNNAAQVWNHDFYWSSMKLDSHLDPVSSLYQQIIKDFNSVEELHHQILNKGLTQFGSGWVWLVWNGNKLEVISTSNADNPLTLQLKPLFTFDVWEHAYYIDYRNRRKDYLEQSIKYLINWDFISNNFMLIR